MHYVYVLYSKSRRIFYVGSSSDLKKRFSSHNAGMNISTKSGIPWQIVYYEAYPTKADALNREKKLKHHGKGISEIKKRITLVEDEKVRT